MSYHWLLPSLQTNKSPRLISFVLQVLVDFISISPSLLPLGFHHNVLDYTIPSTESLQPNQVPLKMYFYRYSAMSCQNYKPNSFIFIYTVCNSPMIDLCEDRGRQVVSRCLTPVKGCSGTSCCSVRTGWTFLKSTGPEGFPGGG